jgi:Zn finger protein HypA/HybF involved in hydrogenase expression
LHESSLAQQMLSTVLASAGSARIRAVHGWVSPEVTLSPEWLAIHFSEFARGTAAEGAQFTVRILGPRARCVACGAIYEPIASMRGCPACQGTIVEVQDRVTLGVDRIEVDSP